MQIRSLKSKLSDLNPIQLGHLNTPLDPLPRLSKAMGGPEIWVKRDDLTGLATGGNKVRKLNFVLADMLQHKPDVVLTAGGLQSNQARQTAAACSMLGMPCTLVLAGEEPGGHAQGNYLLDQLVDASFVWAGDTPVKEALENEAARQRTAGKNAYVVPFGASNDLGVCGYVDAFIELLDQCENIDIAFDTIVLASGSGGTQAGLALAAALLNSPIRILGISIIEPAEVLQQEIARLANAAAQPDWGLISRLSADQIQVNADYLGGGYGVMGALEREAIHLTARTEGIILDPVYTGRAMGALIDLVRKGYFAPGERVLFWHTGGLPAVFEYAGQLSVQGN